MPIAQLRGIVETLKISPDAVMHKAILDNGPVWQVLQLETAEQVLAVDSSLVKWPQDRPIGLIAAHATGNECDYEVRMLSPSSGMNEDPITGSLNAALAHWMFADGRIQQAVTISQGHKDQPPWPCFGYAVRWKDLYRRRYPYSY